MINAPKKTVLLITRNFPPIVGGMEKLNQHMFEGLAQHFNAVLIAPKGAKQFVPQNTAVYESPSLSLPIFFLYAFCISIYLAIKLKPSAVMAGSGLTAPFAWLAARLCGARAAVYVHGLDLIADSWIYRTLWLPFIRCCDTVIANSTNTKHLAVAAGVLQERISIVHPGTDIPELNPAKALAFRQQYDLGDCPVLLSVGRITERKGLLPFLQYSWPLILRKYPNAKLVVVGTEPTQALRKDRRSTLADITAYLAKSGWAASVQFLGRVVDETLVSAYQAADVHVFPVLEIADDVEGFGMVAIEAAANGIPSVAFDAGGVADAITQDKTGILVCEGDYRGFADGVLMYLDVAKAELIEACRVAANRYSWHEFNKNIAGVIA